MEQEDEEPAARGASASLATPARVSTRVLYVDAAEGVTAESLLLALADALGTTPTLPPGGPLVRPREVTLNALAEDALGLLLAGLPDARAGFVDARVLACIVAATETIERIGPDEVRASALGTGTTRDGEALVLALLDPDAVGLPEPAWTRVVAQGRAHAGPPTRVVLGEPGLPTPLR